MVNETLRTLRRFILSTAVAGCLFCPAVWPADPPAPTVSGSGDFSGDSRLLTDGRMVDQGAAWDSEACVYWTSSNTRFTIDLGEVRTVRGVVVQVDNNDDYAVDGSADGKTWRRLFTVRGGDGALDDGMDTFSTIQDDLYYLKSADFKPANIRYLKLYATGGDGMYSAAEFRVISDPVAPKR